MLTSRMANEMEEILRRVAAGELTPQEALPLLDAAGAGRISEASAASGDELPAWGTPPGPRIAAPGEAEPPTGAVRVVRINASYRPIQIVADPSVAEAFVSGEHTVRREGSALVVEGVTVRVVGGLPEDRNLVRRLVPAQDAVVRDVAPDQVPPGRRVRRSFQPPAAGPQPLEVMIATDALEPVVQLLPLRRYRPRQRLQNPRHPALLRLRWSLT